MNYELLRCPVCGQTFSEHGRSLRCEAGHCFDLAKEGYVNLLTGSKPADAMGDNKQAARYRRDFLNKGYYAPLRDALTARFAGRTGTLLDLCCGEGYYTAALGKLPGLRVWGFDLAREMVRLAAKRGGATYFVANLASIPLADGSMDYAVHLFAPFHEGEFSRILKPGGRLWTVVPGERHLYGLKELLYATPYPNDEALPQTSQLRLVSRQKVSARVTLEGARDVQEVFHMTPYYFHAGERDRAKLDGVERLETDIEFVIGEYEKP